jgi:hypothetical protein
MQGVDLVDHIAGIQACVTVSRVGFVDLEGDRKGLAHREVAFLAILAADEAAAVFVGLGVVLDDEAARATHHVQANQFAPVVELIALFDGQDRVHTALVLAFELGLADAVLAHVPLGTNADVGPFVDEQAQLGRQVVLGLVVGRGGEQDDLGVAAADVLGNRLVAPPLAVAQVVAFVDQHQAVALEVGQLLGDLRHRQHHAAQAVFSAVALPHRLQVLGADDQAFRSPGRPRTCGPGRWPSWSCPGPPRHRSSRRRGGAGGGQRS